MRRTLPLPLTLVLTFACSACSGSGDGAPTDPVDSTATPTDGGGDTTVVYDDSGNPIDSGVVVLPDGAVVDTGTPPDGITPPDTTPPPPPPDGGVAGGPTGCKSIAVAAGAAVEGSAADTFTWSDGDCKTRVASLIRNDKTDAFGEHGGYLRSLTYDAGGKTHVIKGTGSHGWQGFGYIINHYASTASENQGFGGTFKTPLAGKHHAIHEFKLRVNPGGPVDVTVQWVFMTGRSHPLFAITYDATPAGANTVKCDTRAPYGDMAWDDGKNGDVSGVGWGDKNKFTTTGAGPVKPTSPWDYTKPNVVPYAFEWSNATDSEMGLVATVAFDGRISGDYGGGAIMGHWGKTGTNLLGDIPDWSWPYQLNQYELPYVTNSHRVSWGTTYGAVGQSSYTAYGKTFSGYPYQSYTVEVVLGAHAASATGAAVSEIEAIQGVKVTASRGAVATNGPAGVGRTDKATYAPVGFDPIYAAFAIDAASNAATFTIDSGTSSIRTPVIELRGYTAAAAPSKVTLSGKTLVADADYFATVDSASGKLWLTLNATITGAATVTVE